MSRKANFLSVPITEVPMAGSFSGGKAYKPVVLVVDDECTIADTLSEILRRSGFNAIAAYDGPSALDAALLNPPQVLITDVVLPGMNGIDLAISMRRIFTECKVILFSGNAATSPLLASAMRAGHNFVLLTKPVHPGEMLAHVSGCMQPRVALNGD
jgi:DNA-binding response OmpR family regulator